MGEDVWPSQGTICRKYPLIQFLDSCGKGDVTLLLVTAQANRRKWSNAIPMAIREGNKKTAAAILLSTTDRCLSIYLERVRSCILFYEHIFLSPCNFFGHRCQLINFFTVLGDSSNFGQRLHDIICLDGLIIFLRHHDNCD